MFELTGITAFNVKLCLTGTPGGSRSFVSLRSLQRRGLPSVRPFESRKHAPMACFHLLIPMCHTINSYLTGTPGGIRTPDLRIRSPSLYPAELQAHVLIIGVRNGARTRDIRNHNPALYQLSYSHHKTYKTSRHCQINNFIMLDVKRPIHIR